MLFPMFISLNSEYNDSGKKMPFTLFHAGPSALIALPLKKYIDVPVFILSNVIIDLEVLFVMFTGVSFYQDSGLHPIAHTFTYGSIIALVWGGLALLLRSPLTALMTEFRLDYQTNKIKILASALLGFWFHLLLDCFYHYDMHPFYPFTMDNPLKFVKEGSWVVEFCSISFIPAIIIYIYLVVRRSKRISQESKR